MKALITGGAGFIGSHLVTRLHQLDYETVVLDDLSSGSLDLLSCDKAQFVKGSVLDRSLLRELMVDVDIVYHLAALVSVQDCITEWLKGHEINSIGTINVFDAAAKHNNVPVVYASSAAVYGNVSGICSEELVPSPLSPYGADKLSNEHQARSFKEVHGLPSFGLRFFNVYGPGQNGSSPYSGVISKFFQNLLDGQPNTVFGTGSQVRDFIYVKDVVEGLVAASRRVNSQPGSFVSNICTGVETSVLELNQIIAKEMGASPTLSEPMLRPMRKGDILRSVGSKSNMQRYLGIGNTVRLEDGIKELAAHLMS